MTFVDTSFWVALMATRDARHADAVRLLRQFQKRALITSNQVRGETWTFMRRRYGHQAAVAFLDALERTRRVEIMFIHEDVEAEAVKWLRRHDEREFSFVDATSFVLMRSLKIGSALTFDADFSAAGFEMIDAG